MKYYNAKLLSNFARNKTGFQSKIVLQFRQFKSGVLYKDTAQEVGSLLINSEVLAPICP